MAAPLRIKLQLGIYVTLALALQSTQAKTLPLNANCTVGGLLPNIPCAKGLRCVLYDEGNIPVDQPALGNCKKVNANTCFDKERTLWFAPGTAITNNCGPCKCPRRGGKIQCKKCVLEGGNCTVGGRFAVPPPGCKKGLECLLYDEGLIAADSPALGNCYKPNANTCFDAARELYFVPGAKISNGCGPCTCPPRGGLIKCKVPIVNCLVDPCQFAKCPKNSSATCVSNYCGGCNAVFYLNGVPVKC
eukprot:TRINITY_DN6946_c0_g3_i1.p1 TRINITY_DN6946_c0_g3~~TRINITY_DN6946_c0_g3_i1.p1  ORF type:complete len:246 (+),score=34.28 TRINITY_DN6946_c0_g3_i1:135-872(+)